MVQNPHIIIMALGIAFAMCIGAYWVGRHLYEEAKEERKRKKEILDGLRKPTWESRGH